MNLEGVFATNWKDAPAKEIFPGIRKRILWQGANGAEAQIVEIDAGQLLPLSIYTPPVRKRSLWFLVCSATAFTTTRREHLFTIRQAPRIFRNPAKAA